jgi:hypothetical protein
MSIERQQNEWICHWLGSEGKKRPAHLAVPSDLAPEELKGYLYDVYHEWATPTNGDVEEILENQINN